MSELFTSAVDDGGSIGFASVYDGVGVLGPKFKVSWVPEIVSGDRCNKDVAICGKHDWGIGV